MVSMFGSESPRNTESVRVSFGPDLAITDIENATKILIQTISKIQDLLQKEVLV
ncbi:hypothetical protein PROCOU_08322 [Listeria rocourtiae FSL F6-920]|nr:hypothetical protein PROCOU_08322 [Listeria rocourtiae FSL F6-920]